MPSPASSVDNFQPSSFAVADTKPSLSDIHQAVSPYYKILACFVKKITTKLKYFIQLVIFLLEELQPTRSISKLDAYKSLEVISL